MKILRFTFLFSLQFVYSQNILNSKLYKYNIILD